MPCPNQNATEKAPTPSMPLQPDGTPEAYNSAARRWRLVFSVLNTDDSTTILNLRSAIASEPLRGLALYGFRGSVATIYLPQAKVTDRPVSHKAARPGLTTIVLPASIFGRIGQRFAVICGDNILTMMAALYPHASSVRVARLPHLGKSVTSEETLHVCMRRLARMLHRTLVPGGTAVITQYDLEQAQLPSSSCSPLLSALRKYATACGLVDTSSDFIGPGSFNEHEVVALTHPSDRL